MLLLSREKCQHCGIECICIIGFYNTSLRFLAAKEEQSGGTVDRPQKIQTSNLVGPFWLSAAIKINAIFSFYVVKKFSQPYLLHNTKGTYHKWPVYSSSTSFFLVIRHRFGRPQLTTKRSEHSYYVQPPKMLKSPIKHY